MKWRDVERRAEVGCGAQGEPERALSCRREIKEGPVGEVSRRRGAFRFLTRRASGSSTTGAGMNLPHPQRSPRRLGAALTVLGLIGALLATLSSPALASHLLTAG